jgi:hypothetical protein
MIRHARIVTLPFRLMSPNQVRGHWGKHAKREEEERGIARLACRGPLREFRLELNEARHVDVLITRLGRKPFDSDNLAMAAKHVRDGVADALDVDDGDERVTWHYAQRIEMFYAIEIQVST